MPALARADVGIRPYRVSPLKLPTNYALNRIAAVQRRKLS